MSEQEWERLRVTSFGTVGIQPTSAVFVLLLLSFPHGHKLEYMLMGSVLFVIGYHVPATRKRDLFYAKLEREREEDQSTV